MRPSSQKASVAPLAGLYLAVSVVEMRVILDISFPPFHYRLPSIDVFHVRLHKPAAVPWKYILIPRNYTIVLRYLTKSIIAVTNLYLKCNTAISKMLLTVCWIPDGIGSLKIPDHPSIFSGLVLWYNGIPT
jgi:hypothetical protein